MLLSKLFSYMSIRITHILFIQFFCFLNSSGLQASNDIEIQKIIIDQKSLAESVKTVVADFQFLEILPQNEIVDSGKYYRSPVATMKISQNSTSSLHVLTENGATRSVSHKKYSSGTGQFKASKKTAAEGNTLSDIETQMLQLFSGPNSKVMKYDSLLEANRGRVKVERVRLDGHACVLITIEQKYDQGSVQFIRMWHDIAMNHAIRKVSYNSPDGSESTQCVIEEFLEFEPGFFFPVKNKSQNIVNGKVNQEHRMVLSNVRINGDLPPDAMKLPSIPSGTTLDDRVSQKKYTIDSSWNRIGPTIDIPTMKVYVPSPEGSTDLKQTDPHDVKSSFATYLFYGSLVALVIFSGWYFLKSKAKRV